MLDGALVNPFAHAVMQSLAVAEALGPVSIANVELDRYRARDIEADDTAAVRLRLASDLPIMVAATLCADEVVEPRVIVHGDKGRAMLNYKLDELLLPGDDGPRLIPGRTGLLDNLVDHRVAPADTPLIAPLDRTLPFNEFVEANCADGSAATVEPRHLSGFGTGSERVVTIPGVTKVLYDAAEQLLLPRELGVPWVPKEGT